MADATKEWRRNEGIGIGDFFQDFKFGCKMTECVDHQETRGCERNAGRKSCGDSHSTLSYSTLSTWAGAADLSRHYRTNRSRSDSWTNECRLQQSFRPKGDFGSPRGDAIGISLHNGGQACKLHHASETTQKPRCPPQF